MTFYPISICTQFLIPIDQFYLHWRILIYLYQEAWRGWLRCRLDSQATPFARGIFRACSNILRIWFTDDWFILSSGRYCLYIGSEVIHTIIVLLEALFLLSYYLFMHTFANFGLKRKRVTKKIVVQKLYFLCYKEQSYHTCNLYKD